MRAGTLNFTGRPFASHSDLFSSEREEFLTTNVGPRAAEPPGGSENNAVHVASHQHPSARRNYDVM